VSISLFCLALATHGHVHWIVLMITSVPFGTGFCPILWACFTYLVVAAFMRYSPLGCIIRLALSARQCSLQVSRRSWHLYRFIVSARAVLSASCAMQECGGLQQAPKLWA
ncbi:hypothetical protein BJY52DRAFT_1326504, partial [Lactarius psammicola]